MVRMRTGVFVLLILAIAVGGYGSAIRMAQAKSSLPSLNLKVSDLPKGFHRVKHTSSRRGSGVTDLEDFQVKNAAAVTHGLADIVSTVSSFPNVSDAHKGYASYLSSLSSQGYKSIHLSRVGNESKGMGYKYRKTNGTADIDGLVFRQGTYVGIVLITGSPNTFDPAVSTRLAQIIDGRMVHGR